MRLETLQAIMAVAAARDPQILQLDVYTVFTRWSVRRNLYGPTRRFYFASSWIRSLHTTEKYLRFVANFTVMEWKIWYISDQGWLQVQWCRLMSSCVYFCNDRGERLILAVYVDDGLFFGTHQERRDQNSTKSTQPYYFAFPKTVHPPIARSISS